MRNKYEIKVLTVLVCFLFFILLFSPNASTKGSPKLKLQVRKQKLIRNLEKVIPPLMEKAHIPGLSIAVIRDGEILWHKGYGIINTKTKKNYNKWILKP